jgi:serine/threonine-protein kinase
MEPERWRQVREVLARAVDAPPEERSALIARTCGEDRELRSEVESLLAADQAADSVLRGLRSALQEGWRDLGVGPPEPPRARTGERFGPYVVEREIGRGGMGEVYLGRRADQAYQGRVAIKVQPRTAAGPELARRFGQERQILASLDHPNVARLLDAGTSVDGEPFFVMEYVEGSAIDEWCDRRRLPVADRLRLFLRVLDAVQAAHRALVVHRDLKPANVLVTPAGVPKLLDFGIAKLLDAGAFPQAAEATITALRPMTLAYASPEQVTGGPITTATDVYGLGVILHRLLTGRLPYRDAVPLERAILHGDPLPASAAVTAEAARDRSAEPSQLRRLLAGDLDVILQTALAKEPSRRYGSAEAFAADLDRHLRGLPVSARRPTFAYRAAKFVRRNRLAAALGTVLAASVLAFAVSMAVLAGRLASERDRAQGARLEAEAERDRARMEELEAEQVAALLVDLFSEPDPGNSRGEAVTAREILDRGMERVTAELEDQPRVQAELLDTIGRAYHELGLFEQAAPPLERGLELRRRTLGPDHPETLGSLYDVAENVRGLGEFERAIELYRQTLDGQLRAVGPDSTQVAETLESLSFAIRNASNDFSEAESLLQRALAIRRLHPDDELGLAQTLDHLARIEEVQRRPREAEALFREARAIRLRRQGEDHPETLMSTKGVADALRVQGRYAEAEAIFRRVLELERRVLGGDHELHAYTMTKLGFAVLYQEGREAEAEGYFRESLRIRQEGLGADHPAVMFSLSNLAYCLETQGRLAEAEALYRRALEGARQSFPAGSHHSAHPLVGLGDVLTARGATVEAEALLREALEARRSALGPDNPLTAQAESSLGGCLTVRGALGEAEELLRHAWAIQSATPEESRAHLEKTRRRIARLEAAKGGI